MGMTWDTSHEGPFEDVGLSEWEVNRLQEAIWRLFREEEKLLGREFDAVGAYKVLIRKLQNTEHFLKMKTRARKYQPKAFAS